MHFEITINSDLSYHKEAYSQIVRSSTLKRLEPFFAIIVILVGGSLWHFDKLMILGYFPILFCTLGIFELIKVYTSRNKWINERLKSAVNGKQIKLSFTEEGIIHNGPFSSGTIKWAGIKQILQTKKGLIVKPETGIAIYLPKTTFEADNQIDWILSKVEN